MVTSRDPLMNIVGISGMVYSRAKIPFLIITLVSISAGTATANYENDRITGKESSTAKAISGILVVFCTDAPSIITE